MRTEYLYGLLLMMLTFACSDETQQPDIQNSAGETVRKRSEF